MSFKREIFTNNLHHILFKIRMINKINKIKKIKSILVLLRRKLSLALTRRYWNKISKDQNINN